MQAIDVLSKKLSSYLEPAQVQEIINAYQFAAQCHEGQFRQSGEPYITHPVAVAIILANMHLDAESLMAALLHDVIEDTHVTKEDVIERFGPTVAELVDGVSKLTEIEFASKAEQQAENFQKMTLAMAKDIRVMLVKLADRLHNMRTLKVLSAAKRRRIARETLEIYAPIAHRLGINTIRLELEDLGFAALYPRRYRVLERALKKSIGNQRRMMKKIGEQLTGALQRESITAEVEGREKHLYSIYRKMRRKGLALSEILDMFGFRIVVEEPWQCYQALGIVHAQYKPMPGRFKDFIAIPRVNGYQSLHTTLFGPNGLPIEVQIRTRDMDRVAESGIAAHWRYKSGDHASAGPQERAREWFQGLMEMEGKATSEEFMESVKVDLFPDKAYVFTPRGDIKRLPRGATCVDFAYAVHTDVGNRCVAAKIDRRPVPLRTQLESGQSVEIITARNARPNPAWVNFVVTAKARASIRSYLKNLRRSEAIDFGKKLLERALSEFKIRLRKISRERMEAVLSEFGLDSADDLYQQVGLGQRLAPFVARRLMPDAPAEVHEEKPLSITGTEGLVVSYARCCYPAPGDTIMGYLSAGRGVVIHRDKCGNLAEFRKQPDKWIAVEWNKDIDEEFSVEINVEARNQLGVLAAVAANIASTESNIDHVAVVDRDGDTSSLTFRLRVTDVQHLERVMRSIGSMPAVLAVERRST